ncbi:MAG TPA: arabinogalactan endo-1,4-beta-galactosidase [Flavobacteriales bacterium]|jgi:arabinogalactan endo-1,4-beta-galactosidase|nr:arabinogalactan endo-1,4-beta-galactosidase [Flavobacteriales bacterium]
MKRIVDRIKGILSAGIALLVFWLMACGNDNAEPQSEGDNNFISAVDISFYPEIREANLDFYNRDGQKEEMLKILKENGVNTIRLRLWVDPENQHSGFNEVNSFSEELRSRGFRIWLTLHYSDSWADPGKQVAPQRWQGLEFEALKDSLFHYTQHVVNVIDPEIIQIGNEVNSGMLHPYGNISAQKGQFIQLLQTGAEAVRNVSETSLIMIHYAGLEGADWFFDQVESVDYDLIGISYYPLWHGKSLNTLGRTLAGLQEKYQKEVLIAETAYPFTLDWNDWTNNIVGLEEQLILPEFPASPAGQKAFLGRIKEIVDDTPGGQGLCYWGAEMVAWKGDQATDGSSWENQALFDFENHALPVIEVFQNEKPEE